MANPFRYSYKTQIVISSQKDLVWKSLIDLENYHLWNPFTPKVETNWKIGEPVRRAGWGRPWLAGWAKLERRSR